MGLVGGDTVSTSGLGVAVGIDSGVPVCDARSDRICLLADRLRPINFFSFVKSSHVL